MVIHSIRVCLQVCGLKVSTLYIPVDITYQSSPCKPAGMQHGCAESNHLETCLQVDNFVGSQPVWICRKENETISVYAVLFSWLMSAAAGPTCRYGLLSRSPEARGNWVWCYTGRNNQEQ